MGPVSDQNSGSSGACPVLTKPLWFEYSFLTACGFCWGVRFPLLAGLRKTRPAQWEAGTGMMAMQFTDPISFLLIPVGLSVAFMAWVFWNLGKDYHRR
jgi:hypothetical protein